MKSMFPSKMSLVAWLILLTSIIVLISNIVVIPMVYGELGGEYSQPKAVNSLALVGFLGGGALYAIERHKGTKEESRR